MSQVYMTAKLNLADDTILYPQVSLDNIVASISDPTLVSVPTMTNGVVPVSELPVVTVVGGSASASNTKVPTEAAVRALADTKQDTLVEGIGTTIINGSTIMFNASTLDVSVIDTTESNGVALTLTGNTVGLSAGVATDNTSGVVTGATNGVTINSGVVTGNYSAGYRMDLTGATVSQQRFMPIESPSGSTVTLLAGHAYKIQVSSGAKVLDCETFSAETFGLEGHAEIFVGATGNIQTTSKVTLVDALEPNAVNNCTVRFHDQIAIISVEDHVAGYIVSSASGTTAGTLYAGLTAASGEYISVDATLNGHLLQTLEAVTTVDKHIVGNGIANTSIEGDITCGAALSIVECTVYPLDITGSGSLTVVNAVIDFTESPVDSPIEVTGGVTIGDNVTIIDGSGNSHHVDPRSYATINKDGSTSPANYVYGYAQGTTQATSNYVPIVLENNVISKVAALDRNKMSCHERRIVVMDDCSMRHINYYLNPSDLTKKLDGTTSVLDGTDGDVMTEVMPYYRLRIQLAPQNDTETRECVLMSRYPFAYTDSNNVEHVAEYFKPFKISPTGDEVRPQYIGYYQASTEIVGVAGKVTEVAALGATSIKVQLTTSDSQDVNYLQGTGKLVIGANTVNYTARSYSGGVFTFTCAALPAAVAVDDAVTVVGRAKLRSVSSTAEKYVYPTVSLALGPTGSQAATQDSFLCRAEHNGATICNELHYEMLFDLFVCDKLTVNTQSVANGLAGLSLTNWGTIYPRACGYTNQVENFYGGSTLADSRDEDIINFWGNFTITSGGVAYTTDAGGCTWHEDATTGKRIVDVYRWRNGTSPNFTYVYTKGSDGFPTTSTKCYTDAACTEGEAAITAVGTPTAQASRWTSCKYFVENPWGSIWQNLAGFGPFVSGDNLGYFITTSMNRYKEVLKTTTGAGTTVPASGGNAAIEWVGHSWPQTSNWVTTWNMDTFLPLTVGTNVMQDYFYTNVTTAGNLRAGFRGGTANYGSFGGLGSVDVYYGVGNAYASCGARLAA